MRAPLVFLSCLALPAVLCVPAHSQQLAHPRPATGKASQPPAKPAADVADAGSLLVLDRMADIIGSLHSCQFTLRVNEDVAEPDLGLVTRTSDHQVFMTGPDRMHVNSVGERGHRGYWYDGRQIDYYSFTENNYGTIEAPATIMEAIDLLHDDYGVDFPAADFFYPMFTDDLLAQSTRVRLLGTVRLDGRECFRIVTSGPKHSAQIWIANDATFLPVRFIFTDHSRGDARYEGVFSEWLLNPDIPDPVYRFEPPPGAAPVRILSRKKGSRP